MPTWPSSDVSTTNLDAGTDSPAAARADIKTAVDNLNTIRVARAPLPVHVPFAIC